MFLVCALLVVTLGLQAVGHIWKTLDSEKESQMSIHKECVDFKTLNDMRSCNLYICVCVCVYIICKYLHTLIHIHTYTYMSKKVKEERKKRGRARN